MTKCSFSLMDTIWDVVYGKVWRQIGHVSGCTPATAANAQPTHRVLPVRP